MRFPFIKNENKNQFLQCLKTLKNCPSSSDRSAEKVYKTVEKIYTYTPEGLEN